MNVKIETYRGIEITFNTSAERFSFSFSDEKYGEKQSYSACKKAIDDYLKDNQNFKPFFAEHKQWGDVIKIIGIRKDNRFIIETNGKKEQLSEYNEKDYIEVLESNKPIRESINKIRKQEAELSKQRSDLYETITGKTLKQIKEENYKNTQ